MATKETDALEELRVIVAAQAAQIAALAAAKPTVGEQALAMLAERSAPTNNPDYNEVSVFTYPEGERVRPKPVLTRDTFFCGSRVRHEELTPTEIHAFNAITEAREVRKNNGMWSARIVHNGTADELHVDVPSKTADDRQSIPSLLLVLAEINGGAKAVDPMALAQRIAQLEADNREMATTLHKLTA